MLRPDSIEQVPATIAILEGTIRVGLSRDDLELLGKTGAHDELP